MKHSLITSLTAAVLVAAASGNARANDAATSTATKNDQVDEASQFQIRGPINSAPEDAALKPGSDNYRRIAPFPSQFEHGLLKQESQAGSQPFTSSTTGPPGSQARLTSIIGANAQLKVHDKEIDLGPLKGLLVEVFNGTDRPLIFDGDRAIATVGGSHLNSASVAAVDMATCPVKSGGKRFVHAAKASIVAGVTIGAVPAIRDAKIQAKPVPERYGCDEARRVDELTRFGKRILWPGDTTAGIVYFKSSADLTAAVLKDATIEMPVTSLFDTSDQASITKTR